MASAVLGAKKGYDAKKNYDEAGRIVRNARADFEEAKEKMERQREQTNAVLQTLGELRLTIEGDQMARFVTAVSQVNQIEYRTLDLDGRVVDVRAPDLKAVATGAYEAADLLKDGVGAVSSGVLTGIGVGGLATQIGVASTGTAIGTLSGAAATNATLAWLGGGSLAAGGMGVAGGTAILGGAIAGPVIAVMGYSAAKKSEKALTAALSQESEILEAREQILNGITVLNAIDSRAKELHQVLVLLRDRFELSLTRCEALLADKARLQDRLRRDAAEQEAAYQRLSVWTRAWRKLTGRRPDFSFPDPFNFNHFSESERRDYMLLTALGYGLYGLLKTRLFDDDGNLNDGIDKVLAEGESLSQLGA